MVGEGIRLLTGDFHKAVSLTIKVCTDLRLSFLEAKRQDEYHMRKVKSILACATLQSDLRATLSAYLYNMVPLTYKRT